MSNRNDFTNKNTTFTGTDGIILPIGDISQRVGTTAGKLRYNSETGLTEQYNSTGWQGIDSPPTVSNISGTINADTNSTITINGSNFKPSSTVTIEGAGVGGVARAVSTTYVGSSSLTFESNADAVNYTGGASFNVRVTNPSGLSAILEPAGTVDRDPVWSTSAGSLGTLDGGASSAVSVTATDPDGNTITYSITTGSLPSGLSLNTSTGAITGTVPDTTGTSSFTIRATANGYTADRAFSITTRARLLRVNSTTYYETGSAQTVNLTSAGTVYNIITYKTHNLRVTAVGAAGSTKWDIGGGKGKGGSVTGTYASIPVASDYYVVVGQQTSTGVGGYPGGGTGQEDGSGGGGFSGFWKGTSDPLAVGNRSTYFLIGGAGGAHSNDAGANVNKTNGGDGGYPNGTEGNFNSTTLRIAQGGTQSAGGLAGLNTDGNTQGSTAGQEFYGGNSGLCGNGTGSSGAGGGGWFGGGGGGGAHCGQGGGAGGGGSSYYNATYISSFSNTNATNSGNGTITLEIGV